VVGTALAASTPFEVYLRSTPVLIASGSSDAAGRLEVSGVIPDTLELGEHSIAIQTMDGTVVASVAVTVVEAPATEEPGTEEPGTEQPGTQEPGAGEPSTEVPAGSTPDSATAAENAAALASTGVKVGGFVSLAALLLALGAFLVVRRRRNGVTDNS